MERLRRRSGAKYSYIQRSSCARKFSTQKTADGSRANESTLQEGVAIFKEGEAHNILNPLFSVEEDQSMEEVDGASSLLRKDSSSLELGKFRRRSNCVSTAMVLAYQSPEERDSIRMTKLEKLDSNLSGILQDLNIESHCDDCHDLPSARLSTSSDSSATTCDSRPSARRRRNGVSENILQAKKDAMVTNQEEENGVQSSSDSRGISQVNSSVSISSSDSYTSYESAMSTLSFSDFQLDLPSPVEKCPSPTRMARCASDQKMNTSLASKNSAL